MKTADICDKHDHVEVLEPQFADYGAVTEFHGQAVTIRAFEDNSLVRAAVAEPGEGKVLVVDGGASMRRAMLGGNLAVKAEQNGWAGIIINGCVRDSHELIETDIGIKALGSAPRRTEKNNEGERDVIIGIGGVKIAPGDWVYADDDGIVVSRTKAH